MGKNYLKKKKTITKLNKAKEQKINIVNVKWNLWSHKIKYIQTIIPPYLKEKILCIL